MISSLNRRSEQSEQMDSLDLPLDSYSAVLDDLRRINIVTLAARPTLAFLSRIIPENRHIRVLDVGYGHGDMLRSIAHWAKRRGVAASLVGVDLNPRSKTVAEAATPADLPISFRTGDYADFAGEEWDVIVSSLVAHHMTRPELVAFLRFMEREARCGWFINDLHRQRVAYATFPLLARLMRAHRIVREDGQLSIARSFRASEWVALLAEARITGATVDPIFPYRLCVSRRR